MTEAREAEREGCEDIVVGFFTTHMSGEIDAFWFSMTRSYGVMGLVWKGARGGRASTG